jgi:hypothetical protein
MHVYIDSSSDDSLFSDMCIVLSLQELSYIFGPPIGRFTLEPDHFFDPFLDLFLALKHSNVKSLA